MGYVVYHKETTIVPKIKKPHYITQSFETERAAKAALTRADRDGKLAHPKDEYAIADGVDFRENIEKFVERRNMMTGEKFMERINTPGYMSTSSEAYWSM